MAEFYAHSLEGHPPSEWETLAEHEEATARLCRRFFDRVDRVGMSRLICLSDVWRPRESVRKKDAPRGGVIGRCRSSVALRERKLLTMTSRDNRRSDTLPRV